MFPQYALEVACRWRIALAGSVESFLFGGICYVLLIVVLMLLSCFRVSLDVAVCVGCCRCCIGVCLAFLHACRFGVCSHQHDHGRWILSRLPW